MLGAEAIYLGAGLGGDHFGYPPVDAWRAIQAIDVVIVFDRCGYLATQDLKAATRWRALIAG